MEFSASHSSILMIRSNIKISAQSVKPFLKYRRNMHTYIYIYGGMYICTDCTYVNTYIQPAKIKERFLFYKELNDNHFLLSFFWLCNLSRKLLLMLGKIVFCSAWNIIQLIGICIKNRMDEKTKNVNHSTTKVCKLMNKFKKKLFIIIFYD